MLRSHPALLEGCETLLNNYRLLADDEKAYTHQLIEAELRMQRRTEAPVVLHILGQEYIPTDHQDEGAITAYDLLLEAQVYDCLDRTYVDDRKPFVTYWRRIVSLALPVISYFLATI